jgi:hypothetical protein
VPPDLFYYKSLGTRDFRVEYDPSLDPSPVKKGKEVLYRYDGAGLEGTVTDPRKATDQATLDRLKKVRTHASRELTVISYTVSTLILLSEGKEASENVKERIAQVDLPS